MKKIVKNLIATFLIIQLTIVSVFAENLQIKTSSDLVKFAKDMQDKVLIENYRGLNDSIITRITSLDGNTMVVRIIKVYHNKMTNIDTIEDATLKCNEEITPDKCEVLYRKATYDLEKKEEKLIARAKHGLNFKPKTPVPFLINDSSYFFDIPFTYKPACISLITKAKAEEKNIKLVTMLVEDRKPSLLTVLLGVPLFVVSFAAPIAAPILSPAVTGLSQAAANVAIGAGASVVQGVTGGVGANLMENDGSKNNNVNSIPECVFENSQQGEAQ